MDVRMGDRLSAPEPFETGIEDGVEGGSVDPHGGDESTVIVALVQTYPRCSNMRVGEQAQASKVLPAGAPILYRPCMILIGAHNKDRSKKAHLAQGFAFFISFKLMLRNNAVEEVKVIVHG